MNKIIASLIVIVFISSQVLIVIALKNGDIKNLPLVANVFKVSGAKSETEIATSTEEIIFTPEPIVYIEASTTEGIVSNEVVQASVVKSVVTNKTIKAAATTTVVTATTTPVQESTMSSLEILNKVKPSVVYIEGNGIASGVIVSTDGYILTTSKVVSKKDSVDVWLLSGNKYEAAVIGKDENIGLSVVKIDKGGLNVVSWGDGSALKSGKIAFAVGYSSKDDVDFNDGEVSGHSGDYISTSLVLPTTNGGPLVDEKGNVIGIATPKPFLTSNAARWWIPQLKAGRSASLDGSTETGEVLTETIKNFKQLRTLFVIGSYLHTFISDAYNVATYDYYVSKLKNDSLDADGKKALVTELIRSNKKLLDVLGILRKSAGDVNNITSNEYSFTDLTAYQRDKIKQLDELSISVISYTNQAADKIQKNINTYEGISEASLTHTYLQGELDEFYNYKIGADAKRADILDHLDFILSAL